MESVKDQVRKNLTSLEAYRELESQIADLTGHPRIWTTDTHEWASDDRYADAIRLFRDMGKNDLFFLLNYILDTRNWEAPDRDGRLFFHPWALDICRKIQFEGRNKVKIMSRYHGKSTMDTLAENIRCVLEDPDITIGLFSINKSTAESFLFQIAHEMSSNELLKRLYPDVLYWEPRKESDRWSIQSGIIVKRKRYWKNATIEAHGLVDGNYTGSRFKKRHYDDMINEKHVTSGEMIDKANRGFALSHGTAVPGGYWSAVGTFYAKDDPYVHAVRRGYGLILHPCYAIDHEKSEFDENGLPVRLVHDEDTPVFYSKEQIEQSRRDMGEEFAIQMLCDPNAGGVAGFKEEWLRYYDRLPGKERRGKKVYILVDPANERKQKTRLAAKPCYTAMWVLALGADGNIYVIDGVRRRMDLAERTDVLFDLTARWKPIEIRYERYGIQADIPHIEYVGNHRGFRIDNRIVEVAGSTAKNDRIKRLIPLFKAGRIYMPRCGIEYIDEDGKEQNLVEVFRREEYLAWPNTTYVDMLDAMARIQEPEMPLRWPKTGSRMEWDADEDDPYMKALKRKGQRPRTSWMAA